MDTLMVMWVWFVEQLTCVCVCGFIFFNFFFFFPQLGPKRIHTVRVRGGNKKYRALRLDVGNFSWGSECKCV